MTPVNKIPKVKEGERSGSLGYNTMVTNTRHLVDRSYEDGRWYYATFVPLNKAYEKDEDWFKVKGLSKCRDLFKKPDVVIMTREILNCKKVHINALVYTSIKPKLNNKSTYCNKYYVHLQICDTLHDRRTVLFYIIKETRKRTFVRYLDYIIWDRKKKPPKSLPEPSPPQGAGGDGPCEIKK